MTVRNMKTAFITGAGGFIGRHLVEQLLVEGVAVTALMMPGEPVPKSWGEKVRTVTGDVRTLTDSAKDIGPFDTLFHLAAVVSDWGAHQDHVDTTVHGTEQAIELALNCDAHFVVTTSVCAYASALARGHITENTPVGKPTSPYEFCKQQQEKVTLNAVKSRGLKATIIRPGNVFGVGSGPWVSMIIGMMKDRKPCLLGSGDWDAGLVHVRNLVALMIGAAHSNYCNGDIFIGSDGFGVTWKTYTHRLAEITGAPPPKSVPNIAAKALAPVLEWVGHARKQKERPPITRQSYRLMGGPNEFSTEKCERLLRYKPVFSFEQAMQELADEFGQSSQPTRKGLKS